jgi:RNA polymerase sigma-70 factor, ECF subfamily
MMTHVGTDAMERFTRCWVEAQPAIAGYIASLVPNLQDAQDILQKTAVATLRKFSQFNAQRPFLPWTLGIARYEILAHQRHHARNRVFASEKLHEDLAAAWEELLGEMDARARFLAECVEDLDDRPAQLIRLRYEESLRPGDIALQLGMNAGAVRVALSRIRSVLRECIERKLRQQLT